MGWKCNVLFYQEAISLVVKDVLEVSSSKKKKQVNARNLLRRAYVEMERQKGESRTGIPANHYFQQEPVL